jgi:hypothetical protein
MVYVVERYLPSLSRADLLPRLARLGPVIEALRTEGPVVRYLGSAIVLEDEACFCQFEGSSAAAVIEANRRADLPFDRIVAAVLVQPTHRSDEMSISTSIPKTAGRRRSRPLAAIAAIAVMVALTSWAIATRVVHSGTRSVRSSAPAQASVLRSLTPQERQYVLGIESMTPVEVAAAFNASEPSVPTRNGGSGAHALRSGAPTLDSVLRSLTPRERRYVLGITSLTPLQIWAAFGSNPTPAVEHGGTTDPGAAKSASLALPILPACGPGPCWRGTASSAQQR